MRFDPLPYDDSRPSSANVQAEIYRLAVNAGLDCVCEYTHDLSEEVAARIGKKRLRIDCALVHDGVIFCAAEAKRYKYLNQIRELDSKQAHAYSLLPIPVYFVARRRHAAVLIDEAMAIIRHPRYGKTRDGQIRGILEDGCVEHIPLSTDAATR